MKIKSKSKLRILYEKLTCPLVSALINIFALQILFFQFFEIKSHYSLSISNDNIQKKIEQIVDYCGSGYWVSWIVIDNNSNPKKYFFNDVIGCKDDKSERESCSFSVKHAKLNRFYNKSYYKLDNETYNNCLKELNTGAADLYYTDQHFNYLRNNCPSVFKALKSTNEEVEYLGISTTKKIRDNLVYVFSMTKTNNSNNKCGRSRIMYDLENLSIYAKQNL